MNEAVFILGILNKKPIADAGGWYGDMLRLGIAEIVGEVTAPPFCDIRIAESNFSQAEGDDVVGASIGIPVSFIGPLVNLLSTVSNAEIPTFMRVCGNRLIAQLQTAYGEYFNTYVANLRNAAEQVSVASSVSANNEAFGSGDAVSAQVPAERLVGVKDNCAGGLVADYRTVDAVESVSADPSQDAPVEVSKPTAEIIQFPTSDAGEAAAD